MRITQCCLALRARLGLFSLLFVFLPILAQGAEPREPGLNELVILDPGAHEEGLPAPRVTEDGQVDIPATLHIHRYYYTGNREFQGPIITGGPTIVVAQHPVTGERLYIDVMLPAGAPVIAHNKYSISYVFPDQRIVIRFSHLFSKKVTVVNRPGRGLHRSLRASSRKICEKLKKLDDSSRLTRSIKDVAVKGKNMTVGIVGVAGQITTTVIERTNQLVDYVPGTQLLQSVGEQADERMATEEIRQAGLKQAANARKFLPTLR